MWKKQKIDFFLWNEMFCLIPIKKKLKVKEGV